MYIELQRPSALPAPFLGNTGVLIWKETEGLPVLGPNMTKGQKPHNPTKLDRAHHTLAHECGGYYTVYPAFQEWAGGELKGRSRAIVWSAIFDMARHNEGRGNFNSDGSPYHFKFNDSYWLPRLRMNRKTFRASIEWLESVGAIEVSHQSKDGDHPIRYVAVVAGFLETMIARTGVKGKNLAAIQYPSLCDAPKRERPKKREDVVTLDTEVNVQSRSFGGVTLDTKPGNVTTASVQSRTGSVSKVDRVNVQSWTDKSEVEDIKEDIESNGREGFSENSDKQLPGEALAAHTASGVDLLRKIQDISLVPGNEQQQHKPSAPKETKEAPAPQLPGKGEEAARPSVREMARAFSKPSQLIETIKDKMLPLSSVNGDPWYPVGFEDRGSVAVASSLGWKYAVRGNDLLEICKIFPGCPIESWDIWENLEDEDGNKLKVEDRKTDHGSCLAAVQAWLKYAESKGLPDPWEVIAGKDRDTEWPRIVTRATKGFPTWEDEKFTDEFTEAYRTLRRPR